MYIARDIFYFAIPLTMMFAAVLSVATGVGGCMWPISAKAVLVEVDFWQFSNNPPSYASVADSMTSLMILHSTCTGPFSGGISWIYVLELGPRENILLICFVPPVLIYRMHQSICG